jgi:hypothetical protein
VNSCSFFWKLILEAIYFTFERDNLVLSWTCTMFSFDLFYIFLFGFLSYFYL